MSSLSKWEKRKNFLLKYMNIEPTGRLMSRHDAQMSWEDDDDGDPKLQFANDRERRFVQDLDNVFLAHAQSRGCPCSDCITTFVVRAVLFYRTYIEEESR